MIVKSNHSHPETLKKYEDGYSEIKWRSKMNSEIIKQQAEAEIKHGKEVKYDKIPVTYLNYAIHVITYEDGHKLLFRLSDDNTLLTKAQVDKMYRNYKELHDL